MTREDPFATMEHWRKFRDAGVSIVTCQRGKIDFGNLGGLITVIVDQYSSHDEVVKLAHRVVSGKQKRLLEGKGIGGHPFGFDREIRDEAGNLVRRVHYLERFRKPPTWTSNLVVSEQSEVVRAVRYMFKAAAEGQSLSAIARELKRRNIKGRCGHFCATTVRTILVHPTKAYFASWS